MTRNAANDADMFSFFPLENPTHLIFCIENSRPDDGSNVSIQAIHKETGQVTDVLFGMDRCDGIRTTPWGTVLATEETDDGAAYELLNPLSGKVYFVMDRGVPGGPAIIVDYQGNDASDGVVKRTALGTLAWEGLTVLSSGVVYYGDELRPGTDRDDVDGGALFKFVPDVPRVDDGIIFDLEHSPFASGRNYAFRADCREGEPASLLVGEGQSGSFPQFGQGCEIGNGSWVPVSAANARVDADANGATGYYRPEDLHRDPVFQAPEDFPGAVRFCWANTGRVEAQNFAEVICGVDLQPLMADGDRATVVVNRFVEGDSEFNSMDNLAFQPVTGNLYVIEDAANGDVWACLRDGADRGIKTDGCVRVLSVKDQSAEPTGFEFDASGTTAFLAIQHSDPDVLGDTDDIIKITGFKVTGKNGKDDD
ncbi:protein of unknown function DUF839 [Nitrosococcus halophilus Nc 4]|uniref:Phosphatase n=1 Tax=Nitrosococcus halophilus (strain Nc4) TaxID=472759 RepID=D5C3S4_NITHN|nr:alkaline phosphatase PhoX [Nitrosococcus halophilus]ADE15046.1 protein of unknown function DUF839 [Nitrosococcus halophilus Nc 4]